jgi:sortase A
VAFAEVVDVSDVVRRRRMRLVQFVVMRALAVLLIDRPYA